MNSSKHHLYLQKIKVVLPKAHRRRGNAHFAGQPHGGQCVQLSGPEDVHPKLSGRYIFIFPKFVINFCKFLVPTKPRPSVVGVESSTVGGVPEIGPKVGIGKGFVFFLLFFCHGKL
jgi:hypothetical protein